MVTKVSNIGTNDTATNMKIYENNMVNKS